MWHRVCREVLHSKDGSMKAKKYIVFEAGSRAGLSAEYFSVRGRNRTAGKTVVEMYCISQMQIQCIAVSPPKVRI